MKLKLTSAEIYLLKDALAAFSEKLTNDIEEFNDMEIYKTAVYYHQTLEASENLLHKIMIQEMEGE
jgi:hypothetical protein